MCYKRVESVYRHSKAKGTAKAVLAYLAHRADHNDGTCRPPAKRIAKEVGFSERAVHEALKTLLSSDEHALELVSQGGTTSEGKKLANTYRVTVPLDGCAKCTGAPDAPVKDVPNTDAPNAPVHVVPKTGAPDAPARVRQMHPNDHTQPSKETTTCGHAQAKANAPAPEQSSSSFLSVDHRSEEEPPSSELSPQDRLELDQIATEFDSDDRQKAKAEACAKRRGMAFVREQAEIVRSQGQKIHNPAGAFERACDSSDGWKRRKPAIEPERKRKSSLPASSALKRWQSVRPDERAVWLEKLGRDQIEAQYGVPNAECLAALENLFAHEPPEPDSSSNQNRPSLRQIAEAKLHDQLAATVSTSK